jgi:AraC family transcriptional regulator
MEVKFKTLDEKKLVGKRLLMSLSDNKTQKLWESFMPLRKEIGNRVDNKLFSLQNYHPLYFINFDADGVFEKWAAVEVSDFTDIPENLEKFTVPAGLYAVFLYKGLSGDGSVFRYIFSEWLPNSDYTLDHRPHFELLDHTYKNNDPNSEEEIWIPVKEK